LDQSTDGHNINGSSSPSPYGPSSTEHSATIASVISPPLHFQFSSSNGTMDVSMDELRNMNQLLEMYDETNENGSKIPQSPHDPLDEEERNSINVYVEPPHANLMCPIHRGLFNAPVIGKCGHTFCRSCITKWIESGTQQMNECPVDKVVFGMEDMSHLINNIVVQQSILSLKVYCKYGIKKEKGKWKKDDNGCNQTFTLSKKKRT